MDVEVIHRLTSFGPIVDDNPEAITKPFLLCYNLCSIQKIAQDLDVPFFCLKQPG
jgi:hypothetical protein